MSGWLLRPTLLRVLRGSDFSRDGRVFQGMIGRLLPVGVHGGKAHPIDGELVLH